MAKAFMCDRCGKFYVAPLAHIERKEVYASHSLKDKSYDLCEHCLSEFDEWIKEEMPDD